MIDDDDVDDDDVDDDDERLKVIKYICKINEDIQDIKH